MQCRAIKLAQLDQLEDHVSANMTRSSYTLVACYDSSYTQTRDTRPLSDAYWSCDISECMDWVAGYTYFGFGCPMNSCFECRRGNAINDNDAVLGCEECGGKAEVVQMCSGSPVLKYNGIDWLMGGRHRDPVYTAAKPGSQREFCPSVTATRPLSVTAAPQ